MSQAKQKKPFQATTLRLILGTVLALILGGMAGGFYWFYGALKSVADETATVQTEAAATDSELQRLKALEQELKKYSAIMEKSQQIVAESQSYQYQNQIISDLTNYAGRAGLSITGFNFQDQSSSQSSSQSSDQSASPSTNTSGLKTIQVSVQLGEGTKYQNLLHFMHLIEQNLTRMQISNVSIAKGEDGNISTQALNIEVYVR